MSNLRIKFVFSYLDAALLLSVLRNGLICKCDNGVYENGIFVETRIADK